MIKILISGYYGFGNLGDEWILSTLLEQLKQRYPESEITVLSETPQLTAQKLNVRSLSRWSPWTIIREMWNSDLFVLGGGGLFQDATSSRSLLYYLSLIAAARFLQTHIVLYAMGVESITNNWAKRMIPWLLKGRLVTITVRDRTSKERLVSLGVNPYIIHVTGDPLLTRDFPKTPLERYASWKKSVLIIPRFPLPDNGFNLLKHMVHNFKNLREMMVSSSLFQMSTETQYYHQSHLKEIFPWEFMVHEESPEDFYNLVEKFNFVVSARFHGLVMAAMAHKPFIGIGDENKIGPICAAFHMPFLPWDASPGDIDKAIDFIWVNQNSFLSHNLDQWKRAADRTIRYIPSIS